MVGFSIDEIPFSYVGSWFNLSRVVGLAQYADDLHLVSHQRGLHPVLRLTPLVSGRVVAADVKACPATLTWSTDEGIVEAAYQDVDTLRIRGRGLGFAIHAAVDSLTPFTGPYFYRDPRDGGYVFSLYETGRRYRITVLSGEVVEASGLETVGKAQRGVELADGQDWEIAVEEYDTSRPPFHVELGFDDVVSAARETFGVFAARTAPFPAAQFPAAELAAYTLWSATVRPAGFLQRRAVLMSKHWMDKVWSWDHCFNALALVDAEPELAWDQYLSVFDHQDASGALPDSMAHSEILYNFVKPPIHGWTVRALLRRSCDSLTAEQLDDVYTKLARWTSFWLDHRRAPSHELPFYQHGNDSGWDNATTFDHGRLVESADLSAFLILQLDVLADLARELGHPDDVERWNQAGARLYRSLFDELWDGTRFAARSVETGQRRTSASLLNLMPIVLGEALPAEVSQQLAEHIRAHLAPAGPATERPDSNFYESDGYWRGPVWAPSTVLIEDGLRRAGHVELADEVSARFRAVCERAGFAENFDAITGEGLRDRAYTWTASAYLLLCAQEFERTQVR